MPSRKTGREHEETWERARRLYLAYPLLTTADIARLLGVSRQRVHACIKGLEDRRETLREAALNSVRKKEKL